MKQLFQDGNKFYFVEVIDGKIILKVKENGWSDIWSLPIKEMVTG
jgi:hypothetical protein